jgi:hypothetical protein
VKKVPVRIWLTIGSILVLFAASWFFFEPGPIFYFTTGWLIVIALLLWFGNRQLTLRLDRTLPWSRYGNWRFFIQLLLGLAYLLLLVNGIYYAIKVFLTDDPPTREQFTVMNVWGAAIFIPAFSLYFSLHFLRHWRESELEVAKSQKESMRSQLDSLKNHLDPHFLFNNLNILSSLIDKDSAISKRFIEKFAEVYRALLNTKSDDLIPVYEELSFIESYMYLIHIRFENHIRFIVNLESNARSKMIPPLTLQMLIENAIKHNLITDARPLTIEVLANETHLLVRNSLFLKPAAPSENHGSGLKNIEQRYAHFTDLKVEIRQSEDHFEVLIPLLEVGYY